MRVMRVERLFLVLIGAALAGNCGWSAENAVLSDTKPLTMQGDLSEQMVAGIQQFLLRQIDESITNRAKFWHRDFSSAQAYERSIETNRARLRERIGAFDPRLPVREIEYVSSGESPALVGANNQYAVFAVRWPLFAGVYGEGLLVVPRPTPIASVVVLPDADQTPEMLM